MIGVGTRVGDGDGVLAAEVVARGDAIAFGQLGRLQVGRIAGDLRDAEDVDPGEEGVGDGGVGVIARIEVVIAAAGRGDDRRGVGQRAAGALERGERDRDLQRNGDARSDGDVDGRERVAGVVGRAAHARPGRVADRQRRGRGDRLLDAQHAVIGRRPVVDEVDLVVAQDDVARRLGAFAGVQGGLREPQVVERQRRADGHPRAADIGRDRGGGRQSRRRHARGRDGDAVARPVSRRRAHGHRYRDVEVLRLRRPQE